jgi:hypothetical protein
MFKKASIIMTCLFVWVAGVPNSRAQPVEHMYTIDHPTAGLLEHGSYEISGRVGPESSFLLGIRIGFRNLFQVGMAFGMQRVFDRGRIEANDVVGIRFRIRLLEETIAPALAIGFDSQGQGMYHKDLERYDRKSPGLYAVLSKNYALQVGEMSLHGGVSWSTEREDDDDPDFFVAAEWRLEERLAFLIDADAALNDKNNKDAFGRGGIYLDGAIRWTYDHSLSMMLIFRDLSGNFAPDRRVGREFDIALIDYF